MTRPALPPGTQLQRYVLQDVLGAGGFGITYRASHAKISGRLFAVKEYFPDQFATRAGTRVAPLPGREAVFEHYRAKCLREAEMLSACGHPAVVPVIDFIETNGTAYTVLDFVSGHTLKDRVTQQGPLDQDAVDKILMPLLSALELVHAKGLLHRDIAPDNILIRDDGSPCLIDFGSARAADVADPDGVTRALVKYGYSPPEQYDDTSTALGPWTDIYALAATLRRAITNDVPPDAMSRVSGSKLAPLRGSARARGFRPAFLDALDHALELDRRARPQSIADWRVALFAEGPPKPRGQGPAFAATKPFERPDESLTVPDLTVVRRSARKPVVSRWAAAAILGVLLIAGGIAGFVFTSGDKEKTESVAAAPVSDAVTKPAEKIADDATSSPAPTASTETETNASVPPTASQGDEIAGTSEPEPVAEPARGPADERPADATSEQKVAALEEPPGADVDLARRLAACEALSGGAAEAACSDVAASSTASPAQTDTANLRLGALLQQRGAKAEARTALDRVTPGGMTADAFNLRGALAAAADDYDVAVPDLSEAVRRAPQNGEYRNNRAWVYLQQGKLAPAEIDADLAVRHLPSAAYVWDTRGHIREKLGRFQDAAADYRRALQIDPALETSRGGLARVGARL